MTKNTETTPTEFQVGDIVIYDEKRTSNWNGGKAEVVDFNTGTEYTIKVRMLELPPELLEFKHLMGTTSNHRPTDLLPWVDEEKPAEDAVVHPSHYGGGDNPYEVIKVAEAWDFDQDAYLFNVLKYIARADMKGKELEDLKKARFYLDRKIARLEDAQ